LEDDLNVPEALAVVWEAVKDGVFVKEWDEVLGLKLTEISKPKFQITNEIQDLMREREKLRGEGKWEEADKLRQKIEKMGYMLHDKGV
jgi:cysteinyl-tRNA synthetase